MSVCVIYVCVCCVLSGGGFYLRDGQRKEGTSVSMTTHLLVALYKARRGGRERRANCYWQGTLWNKGRPMLPADSNSTPMRSFRTEPACRQRLRLRHKSISMAFPFFLKIIFVLRIPHWTSRLGKAASCHANGRQSAPTTQPRVTSERTPQTHGTCSSIRQDWTKRRATQTKLRVKQNTLGVWEWKRSTCCCCC